jgi:hypothetical protein
MVVEFTTTCTLSAYHQSWRGVLDTTLCYKVCQWLTTVFLLLPLIALLHCSYKARVFLILLEGPSWPWLYGSWIYNYLCNQCLSPLMLWIRIPLRRGVLDTTLCDKVCQLRQFGGVLRISRFPPPIKLTTSHYLAEILLKVALKTIKPANQTYILSVEPSYL